MKDQDHEPDLESVQFEENRRSSLTYSTLLEYIVNGTSPNVILVARGTFRVLLYLHWLYSSIASCNRNINFSLVFPDVLSLINRSIVGFFLYRILSARMSNSGSRTPTHNPVIPNIIKSPQSTTSRPQILDDTPSERLFEDRGRPVTPP